MLKLFRFQSLRTRFLITFLGFTCITIFVAGLGIWFYDRTSKLSTITSYVEEALTQTLQLIKIEQNFSDDEIFSTQFYKSGQSKDLALHKKFLKKVKKKLYNILEMDGIKQVYADEAKVTEDIKLIIQELESYEQQFEQYVNLNRERGFKDDGLEGEMRARIHELENLTFGISQEDMLMLRRHEKDYIIRKDSNYVIALEKLYGKIQDNLNNNPQITQENKKYAFELLNKYLKNFRRIVALESLMGITSREGVRGKMRLHADNAAIFMEKLVKEVNQEVLNIEQYQFRIFMAVIVIAIFLSIFLSYYGSLVITKPITSLSKFIHHAVEKKFDTDLKPEIHSKDEIGTLTHDFNIMLQEIKLRLQEVKDKNQDLERKNDELEIVNRQISESKESLSKVNSVKDTFFSIISHDLRSPLNSLSGFLQILLTDLDKFSAEEIKSFGEETQKSVNRILNLLENLLQWSMSQTGEIDFNPHTLNLQKIVIDNIELYQRIAIQKKVNLKADIPPHFFVYSDHNMMDFVLRNFISNAIKFSKANSNIEISAQESTHEIKITIQDEGIGMAKEHLSKLFQPEEHISTLGTDMEKGTGFGLLLCKNFIERNSGLLDIKSELGKGTVITFTLPKSV